MAAMPYTPTWNNPYLPQPMTQQTMPVMQMVPQQYQQYQQPQQMQLQQPVQNAVPKVDGPTEAMNRFLMQYSNQLNPGFMSEPAFDIDGKHFYVLCVEMDGRRNLETYRYKPEVNDQLEGYVGRDEFDALVGKVDELKGALDGVHEPVQPKQQAKQQQPRSRGAQRG